LKTDILIAHPGKHHALHLVAGCIQSGASVVYITPFYKKGFGRIVSLFPGNIGSKADGYFHPAISSKAVLAPIDWQIRKLLSIRRGDTTYEKAFDSFVADMIANGKVSAKLVITLQDYMPKTVRSAKNRGAKIWSDQILNQSAETSSRIMLHEKKYGLSQSWRHCEVNNGDVIALSDLITVPSDYCFTGIKDRLGPSTNVAVVPYGASIEQFSVKRIESNDEIVVLARAHSVRKGGHLLIRALGSKGRTLLKLSGSKRIKVIILGQLEEALTSMLKATSLPAGIVVEHGNVPHALVAEVYKRASLFVMPSLSESMSLACIEAMHAGLPLVITPYCGIDGFDHGRMGYLASDSIDSLESALVEAFANRMLWPQWGEESRRLASRLTWPKYQNTICKLAVEALS
jgi:glycosyltransferase involved in cell wall biosynthesis